MEAAQHIAPVALPQHRCALRPATTNTKRSVCAALEQVPVRTGTITTGVLVLELVPVSTSCTTTS
jgi:hypothetical protein